MRCARLAALATLAAHAAQAASPAPVVFQPLAGVSGEVACAGGDTMQPLVEAWGRGLTAREPSVRVRVLSGMKLSAEGFAALLAGQADCVTFVREPFPAELAAFQARFGHAPALVEVASGSYATRGGTHALAIYVNDANPLRRMDLTQLDAVLSTAPRRGGTSTATTWGGLGLNGAWATRPIHLYGMLSRRETGNPPGVVNFMQQRVLRGGAFRPGVRVQTDAPGKGALQAIVDRVADDPDGIGYSGFGFARPGVHALALAESDAGPYVAGTPETVRSRAYPLSRRIYIMVDRPPGAPVRPALHELLRFVLSSEGQAMVAADAEGFLPLTAEQATRAAEAIR